MVRIPTLTRRGEHDENADGHIDSRDTAIAEEREAERDEVRGSRTIPAHRRETVDDVVEADSTIVEPAVVEPELRPRASGLATLGLILGVLAAAAVATGILVGPGVVLGLIGALAAVGGVSATGRRHIAGRFDALLGLLLSLAAMVVGLLALADAVPWPDPATNQVGQLADWLATNLPWLNWR